MHQDVCMLSAAKLKPAGGLQAHSGATFITCSFESHVLTAAGGCEQAGEGPATGQHGVHAVAQIFL